MPVVSLISCLPRPEILPIPTYDLNEAEFEDMVEILYSIQDQIGLTAAQCTEDVCLFAGYLFSVNSMSYVFRRRLS